MRVIRLCVALLAALLITACGGGGGSGGGGGNNNTGDFSLTQTTISFKGEIGGAYPQPISIKGTLKNAGSEVYFVVDASKTPLIQSAYVEVNDASSGMLTLVPQTPDQLTPGKNTGTVTVRACKNQSCSSQYSGSPKTITVEYEVTGPEFNVDKSSVDLTMISGSELPAPMTVNLTSSKYVGYYGSSLTQSAEQWLSINQQWNGTTGILLLTANKGMPIGTHKATVELYAHAESLKKTVTVNFVVKQSPVLLSRESLALQVTDSTSLTLAESVKVSGAAGTKWALQPDVNWLDVSHKTGSTDQEVTVEVKLNQMALNLPKGQHNASIAITIASDNSFLKTLPVSVYVRDAGTVVTGGTPYTLNFDAGKIATDEKNSLLYVADKNAKRLYQVDLKTGLTKKYYQFDAMPESMAIAPAGDKLYIALLDQDHSYYWWTEEQSGSVAVLDLATQTIVGSIEVDIDPYDLLVTSSGKMIVSSGSGQWTNIEVYNVSTGSKLGSAGIRNASHLALHPSENWVFAADTDSSPSDFEKFDISGNGITAMGNSPYHGDYWIGGDIWATPDSAYVIVRGGDVFNASNMSHAQGMLTDTSIIDLIFDSTNKNAIVLTADGQVASYSLANFTKLATLAGSFTDARFITKVDASIYLIKYEAGKYILQKL